MTILKAEIRSGAYYDSVILMQLQRALVDLPTVLDAGVVMGTPANKELLAQSDLMAENIQQAAADDLVIVVKAADEAAARSALAQVDELLARRRTQTSSSYRPKTLEAAAKQLPAAEWVLVSVPGRYAADVARQALALDKNVFLYSDNVALDDERDLKSRAAAHNRLVMGPDCGTAIVNGVGLGFANRVRRGSIGLVGASGTGLQLVTARIHQLGGGITHALGTGGRDLSEAVGAVTTRHGLRLLADDPNTQVIVLISKPPAPAVATELLALAQKINKPVVVNFIGYTETSNADHLHFAATLDEAAELAVALAGIPAKSPPSSSVHPPFPAKFAAKQQYLRGLFSGGTLAYEALLLLHNVLPDLYSNVPLKGGARLTNAHRSQGHTVVDLGEDEFTVGRLHPMLDHSLRIRRLLEDAADPETAILLLDVVLGDGAHPDPAAELAPAIEKAIAEAQSQGRHLAVVAVVVGTDADPQDMHVQIERLEAAGVQVFVRNDQAIQAAARLLGVDVEPSNASRSKLTGQTVESSSTSSASEGETGNLSLNVPFAAINVGLESFTQSLNDQGASVVQVDWRPPAGGNEKLMGLLAKMRQK